MSHPTAGSSQRSDDSPPQLAANASCFVTLATPAGRGAVATVVVTGDGAVQVVSLLLRPHRGQPFVARQPRVPVFGRWELLSGVCEEVVACRFSDEQVEVHCHGGPVAAAAIIASLVARGCRERDWLDGAAAEAEADAIALEALEALALCRTERAARILLDQYNGAWRRELAELEQSCQAETHGELPQRLAACLELAPLGLHLWRPWRVVLAGQPNVGKSSLANALAGYERAIVSEVPGTTRDVLFVELAFQGWFVEMADTAGIRATDERIEATGVERAQAVQAAADLVLVVADLSQPWTSHEQALVEQHPAALIVHTKADLVPAGRGADRPEGIAVSGKTGLGLDTLIDAIVQRLVPKIPVAKSAIPFTDRQISLLRFARDAAMAGDLREVRRCLDALARG